MTERARVIVDPHFRAMGDIFSPEDSLRLSETVDVVWGRDEPMPDDAFREALSDAFAVVSSGWRYGPVLGEAVTLKAILTVSGGWPPELDYGLCFERGIRVLSAAPAFGAASQGSSVTLPPSTSRRKRQAWLRCMPTTRPAWAAATGMRDSAGCRRSRHR